MHDKPLSTGIKQLTFGIWHMSSHIWQFHLASTVHHSNRPWNLQLMIRMVKRLSSLLLKGENAVTAVAKVYSVVRNISAHHMQQLKCPLPNGLIADLDQYMEGGTCYDVLLFSQIYDIRSEKLSWADMEKILGCKINRNCGFARILGFKEECLHGIMSKGRVKTFGWAFAEDLVEASDSTSLTSDETANKRRCLTWWHD